MNWMDRLSELMMGGLVFAVIFILSRKLWLWYFKLNLIEKHLADIAAALRPPAARNEAGQRTALPRS